MAGLLARRLVLGLRPAFGPAELRFGLPAAAGNHQINSASSTACCNVQSFGFAAQAAAQADDVQEMFPTIRAVWRTESGSNSSARLRKSGLLPGALQGLPNNANAWLTLSMKQMKEIIGNMGPTKFCSRAWTLEVYKSPDESADPEHFHVVPRLVHRTAENMRIENVVFYTVPKGDPVKVKVLVEVLGDDVCPGVKKGGYPFLLMRTVELICPSDSIPEKVEVDVSELDSEGRVLLEDIPVPEGCLIVAKNQHVPVVKIKGKSRQLAGAAAAA